jgi:hypothetical protein
MAGKFIWLEESLYLKVLESKNFNPQILSSGETFNNQKKNQLKFIHQKHRERLFYMNYFWHATNNLVDNLPRFFSLSFNSLSQLSLIISVGKYAFICGDICGSCWVFFIINFCGPLSFQLAVLIEGIIWLEEL